MVFITRNIIWVCPDRWAGSDPIALAELSSGAANVSSVKQAAVALRPVPLTGAYCCLYLASLVVDWHLLLAVPPLPTSDLSFFIQLFKLFLSVVVRRRR
jgi:hypothetical protein